MVITKVEYYNGTNKIGERTTEPFNQFTWTGAPVGNHTLTAKVFYDGVENSTSQPVNITVSQSSVGTFLVDEYPDTYAAWFPFRIKQSYDKCLRIRRSSDNAETDVLTDSDPTVYISLSSTVSAGGTLGSWLGSDNAFVTTLYDMTGNGRNFVQLATSRQPIFAQAGVIYTDPNGKPAIRGDGSHSMVINNMNPLPVSGDIDFSIFIKQRQVTIGNDRGILALAPNTSSGTNAEYIGWHNDGSGEVSMRHYGGNTSFDSNLPDVTYAQYSIFKSASATTEAWENGTQLNVSGDGNDVLSINSNSGLLLFSTDSGSAWEYTSPSPTTNGELSGFAWFFSNKNTNRADIESIINV